MRDIDTDQTLIMNARMPSCTGALKARHAFAVTGYLPTEYYRRHLPALRSHGEWAAAHCPFHEDKNPSLSVNLVHGGFCGHACGVSDGERHRFSTHSPVSDDAGGHDLTTAGVRCAQPIIWLNTPTKAGKFLPVSADGGSHFAECFGRQPKRLKPDYALM